MYEQNEDTIDRNYKMKKKITQKFQIQYNTALYNILTELYCTVIVQYNTKLNDSLDVFNIKPDKTEERMNKLKDK